MAAAGSPPPARGAGYCAVPLAEQPQQQKQMKRQQQQKQPQQRQQPRTSGGFSKVSAFLSFQGVLLLLLLLLLSHLAAAARPPRAAPHGVLLKKPQQQQVLQQQQRQYASGFLASSCFGGSRGARRGGPPACRSREWASRGAPSVPPEGKRGHQLTWASTWRPFTAWRRRLFGGRRLRIHTEEQMDKALARGVPLASLEVCGDLRPPRPPFNPLLLLRLELLLQRLLSSSSSYDGNSSRQAQASLTRWLCGRSDDPEAFARGAPRLLQQCTTLLEQHVHPVALLLYRRRLLRGRGRWMGAPPGFSGPPRPLHGQRAAAPPGDGSSLALAIEGGAMRGSVCGGMAVCLDWMGFSDSFDAVYGSSAGALIGAFLLSRQLAYEGTCVYTDWLPALGRKFIDIRRIGRALGLGCLLDGDLLGLLGSRLGRPMLDLDALLIEVLQNKQPLRFREFMENNERQPLKIIASGLSSMRSVTLDFAGGSFKDLPSLCECLRASMLLPGMAGPVVHLPVWGSEEERQGGHASPSKQELGQEGRRPSAPQASPRSCAPGGPLGEQAGGALPPSDLAAPVARGPLTQYLPLVSASALPRFSPEAPRALVTEPLADALLFESIPYRSAIADRASHVLVLRSRPDLSRVGRLSGIEAAIELQMARRFFLRKHSLRSVYDFMRRRGHREIYMRDMLRLNAATNSINMRIPGGDMRAPLRLSRRSGGPLWETLSPRKREAGSVPCSLQRGEATAYAMAVAVGGGEKETQKLGANRVAIIRGMRGGFAALWEALQPDPDLRDAGQQEALKIFPDDLPLCPALGGLPKPSPPPYDFEGPSAHLSPAELAEHLLQAAASVAREAGPPPRQTGGGP
ncbi:hypothetical protein Esti_003201 [Eimeria stiedai]